MNKENENDTLSAEIGEAVKTMNAEENNNSAPKQETVTEVAKEETTESAASSFVVDDALIERAVRAGLSVADAKLFTNGEMADRVLKALEAKKEAPISKTEVATNDSGDGFPTAEFEKALKEMEDDGDYDPKFVTLFKQMGGLLKDQSKMIRDLKAAGASAASESAFDKSYSGLDEAVRNHVDAATKSQLKNKFDFLKSAHESANDGVSEEEIFNEAKKLVLGEIESRYAEENKAEAIARRKSLVIARPGGESGNRGTDKPMTEEDIANTLFQQLTK